MDNRKTIWKELIDEVKEKLSKYPIEIDLIYDKYQSLRIDYHWINRDKDYSKKLETEIGNIILDAEAKSEDIVLEEKNRDKKLRREVLTFEHNKTFFGLTVHAYGVKESDIKKLPFYEFWEASAVGSTCAVFNNETYVYQHDWERFCYSFILHGNHRFT